MANYLSRDGRGHDCMILFKFGGLNHRPIFGMGRQFLFVVQTHIDEQEFYNT